VVIAALLGLLGPGPLSRARVSDAQGTIQLEYYRLQRLQAPGKLEITIFNDALRGDSVEVWLDSGYIERFEVIEVEPQPEKVSVTHGKQIYQFAIQGAKGPLKISFRTQSDKFGKISTALGLVGGGEVKFAQFVFP
jgi:hypothetical protein